MIIDRINQQASIKNARKLLKSYGTIRRLATVNTSHPLHEQDKRDLKCIQAVVGGMEDTQASIINMCYLDGSHKTRQYIADTMGYSRSSYNRFKNRALLAFAESYNNQELLVYK